MKRTPPSFSRTWNLSATLLVSFVLLQLAAMPVHSQIPLRRLSADPFTNPSSQHATQVEPDTYSFGSTIVSAFQTGRIFDGGSSDIGFATSTDGGATWVRGFLPGVTVFYKNGRFQAVSDPSVTFDARHSVWIISSLGLAGGNTVLASSSADGLHWNNPVTVNANSGFADKDWIACDNTATSPFFGHCYIQWDDAGAGDQVRMSTSTDGGQSWSAAVNVRNAFGLGGQPVVQPNGTVVVPFWGSGIQAFTSTDGGATWTSPVTVASVIDHGVAGNLRTLSLPSAEVDGAGRVYVVWQDCRFRSGCSSNDIVMSTSLDGRNWTPVSRIPIDPTNSTVDHFIPGIAADPATSGATAHLALTYYFYPVSNCTSQTCRLSVGFVSSFDGGQTWTAGQGLAGGMRTGWLPSTSLGQMVGDYISTSFANGKAFGVFARAAQNDGSKLKEAMFTPGTGLLEEGNGPFLSSAGDRPIPNAKSDHGPRQFYDTEGRIPIPREKQVPPPSGQ